MKLVIDCNVLIAAGLKAGACRYLVKHTARFHKLYISDPILEEFLKVAQRERFKKYQPYLDSYIQLYAEVAEVIKPSPCHLILSDKDDVKYLDLCLFVKADYLITGNIKDFPEKMYQTTQIISPADFIKKYIDQKSS